MAKPPNKKGGGNLPAAARQEAHDAATRGVVRDRFSASLHERVLKMLRALEKDVVGKLSAFDPQDTSGRAKRLRQLQKEIAAEVKRRFELIAKEATAELADLAVEEARWKQASLRKTWNAAGVTAQPALAPTAILEALVDQPTVLGGIAADYWKAEGAALTQKFVQQMQLGVAGGESIGDLIKRVRGSKANNFTDGIMSVSRKNAESLTRTSVNSIANAAHMEVYKQNSDIVEGVQHYSVLDSRTTLICSSRHGLKWKLDGYEPIGHDKTFMSPPLHWRCRSIIVSVLDVEAETPEVNFTDWFDSLSADKQEQLFGKGRAQLWRAGRISQSDLLNQNGRPLTLKELKTEHGDLARAPVLSNRKQFLADPDTAAAANFFNVGPERFADLAEDMLGDFGEKLAGQIEGAVYPGSGQMELQLRGGPITNMNRRFTKGRDGSIEVYHAYLSIDKAAQGSGLGASIMRGSREVYKALGVKKITVTANIDVGGYTWARFGFAPRDMKAFRRTMLDSARNSLAAGKIEAVDLADIESILNRTTDEWRIPYDLAGLTGAHGKKIGKEVMLDTTWRGEVNLADVDHAALFDFAVGKKK